MSFNKLEYAKRRAQGLRGQGDHYFRTKGVIMHRAMEVGGPDASDTRSRHERRVEWLEQRRTSKKVAKAERANQKINNTINAENN